MELIQRWPLVLYKLRCSPTEMEARQSWANLLSPAILSSLASMAGDPCDLVSHKVTLSSRSTGLLKASQLGLKSVPLFGRLSSSPWHLIPCSNLTGVFEKNFSSRGVARPLKQRGENSGELL